MRFLFAAFVLLLTGLSAEAAAITPSATRVKEIQGWMPPTPTAFSPAFNDRAFWDPVAKSAAAKDLLAHADEFATSEIPALNEDLFNDFKKTGQRKAFEKPYKERLDRLDTLVLAEGLENAGRRLPGIEAIIAAILGEPSWVMSAHVGARPSWTAAYDKIDLGASARAWTLATADYLLGDRLAPATRARIRKEVRARVFVPYLQRVRSGKQDDFTWMSDTNNWNAVCHAGVLASALLLETDVAQKAEFAAAFETGTRHFLAGFGEDGLCLEGTGYWNYGFGRFLLGAEALRLATSGKIDLLATPKTKSIASFGSRYEIANRVYPAFSDVTLTAKPAAWITDFVAVRFGIGSTQSIADLGQSLFIETFELALPRSTKPAEAPLALALHDWFPDGGALIARQATPAKGLSIALKGGHNNQPHNHNDLGSYVIVNDGVLALTDLGGDIYVKDTFSSKRYTSGVLNSFGHPVPRVANTLQSTGEKARAVTVKTEFTDAQVTWEQDLTSAYDVPALKRLTRTFIYTRAEGGRLEIVDHAVFKSPQAFGTAVILRPDQNYKQTAPGHYRVGSKRTALDITVDTGPLTFAVNEEPVFGIVPNKEPKASRLGFDLSKPALEATFRTVITPASPASVTK